MNTLVRSQRPDSPTRLLSAALRHLQDAAHLSDPGAHESPEQAEHLAGFAPECARKAILDGAPLPPALTGALHRLLGHGFDETAERAVELALALRPSLRSSQVTQWHVHYAALSRWRPDCRYLATGALDPVKVAGQCMERSVWRLELLRIARDLTEHVALHLWMDGRVRLDDRS